MSTLNIMLEAGRGGEPHYGISTRLTRVAAVDGTKADCSVSTEVAVSAGAVVADSFEVPPGRYVVEAFLPSGDTVSDVCVVPAEGVATVVLGRGDPSLKILPDAGARAGVHRRTPRGTRDFAYPSAAGMLDGTGEDVRAAPTRFRYSRRTSPSAGGRALGRAVSLARPAPTAFHITRYAEPVPLPDVALTLLPGPSGDATYRVMVRSFEVGPGRSVWVHSQQEDVAYWAALPAPWVAALAPTDRADPAGVAVSFPGGKPPRVTVEDRAMGAMLAYLSSSRIDQANLALRDLERRGLAPGKAAEGGGRAFPRLGACYVGVLGRSDPRRWTRAVKALRRLYPASADAAVLLGRIELETARTEGALVDARSLFVAATRMEPPVFMVGVQMLLDGLTVFADEDREAADARRAFVPTAAAVDTTQPFTVLGFRNGRA